MLRKLKKNYFLLISTFLILYFLFSFLGGERGLFSYFKKKIFFKSLKKEETQLISKIKKLETPPKIVKIFSNKKFTAYW